METTDIRNAEHKLEWIKARIAEGREVYLLTMLRGTVIRAEHLPQVRVRNGALQVQSGKRWIDYSYAELRASKES